MTLIVSFCIVSSTTYNLPLILCLRMFRFDSWDLIYILHIIYQMMMVYSCTLSSSRGWETIIILSILIIMIVFFIVNHKIVLQRFIEIFDLRINLTGDSIHKTALPKLLLSCCVFLTRTEIVRNQCYVMNCSILKMMRGWRVLCLAYILLSWSMWWMELLIATSDWLSIVCIQHRRLRCSHSPLSSASNSAWWPIRTSLWLALVCKMRLSCHVL